MLRPQAEFFGGQSTEGCRAGGPGRPATGEARVPYNDFREFLAVLRDKRELIDIDRHVSLTDVSKVMKHSYVRQGPALQFNDTGTDHPLVSNV